MLVYRSTGTCLEINRKLDILRVGERAGFRPPSFPYRMKWTRRTTCQLFRVLFNVRVMLSGLYHILPSPPSLQRGPRLGRSGLSSPNTPAGTVLLLSSANFADHDLICFRPQRMQGCIDLQKTRCKVVAAATSRWRFIHHLWGGLRVVGLDRLLKGQPHGPDDKP